MSNQIEQKVSIRGSRARVWNAITSAKSFGSWFGIRLVGDFEVGKLMRCQWPSTTTVDSIIAAQRRAGVSPSPVRFPSGEVDFCTVSKIDAEGVFSFRWLPYGIDSEADPANEPQTLVTFQLLSERPRTLVTITESGFDRVPTHRRERAYRMNSDGWAMQAENLRRYAERSLG